MAYTTQAAYLSVHKEDAGLFTAQEFADILTHFSAIVNNYLGVSTDESTTGEGAVIVTVITELISAQAKLTKVSMRVDPMEALSFGQVDLSPSQKLKLDRLYVNTSSKPVAFTFNIDTGERVF
jgi:hypothetical protein